MRRFVITVCLSIAIPIAILTGVFFLTDPYKTLKPFSLDYLDLTNRDYLSSELFLMNYPEQHYDSYIFSSSRGCGINTYHWVKYLSEGSNQFLFQAWGETLTGMAQKIDYIDQHGYALKNVLLLLDIPGAFDPVQLHSGANVIKHPAFSHQPKWLFQLTLLYDFLQKPTQWTRAIKKWIRPIPESISFDSVSNDWEKENRNRDLATPPEKDSLCLLNSRSKSFYIAQAICAQSSNLLQESGPLIHNEELRLLRHIREVFDRKGTDYRVVISPLYCYLNPSLSHEDRQVLSEVFGQEYVYDFSGKNAFTEDYNNYSDSKHFGLSVGWHLIEQIYNSENK